MFDDLTLYSAEAKMKYDEITAQARLYRYLPRRYVETGYRRFDLIRWLLRRRRHGDLNTEERSRAGHGIEMGPRYGVRIIQQSVRHS